MTERLCCLLLLVVACINAPAAEQVVVTINGEPLTLQTMEDELLRKEGSEAVIDLVERQLEVTDWTTVADDEVVVAMPGWKLPRAVVAAALLDQHADRVREELINLTLVRQALAKEGLVIDQAVIDAELATMRRRFEEKLAAEGKTVVAFESYIQETQGMPIEEWTAQPGFHILAGVHHLLYQRYPIDDAELNRFLRANYRDYVIEEAVDVSVIYMPYQIGDRPADDRSKQALVRLATNFQRNMQAGKLTWEKTWNLLNRGEINDLGRRGWIHRDGQAERKGEAVPVDVAEMAFAHRPADDQPVLLDPIIHDHGVTLMQVHGYRPARKPSFAELRPRLQRDYIDSDLDMWTKRFMSELRKEAEIDYRSLAELVAQRKAEARALAEQMRATGD